MNAAIRARARRTNNALLRFRGDEFASVCKLSHFLKTTFSALPFFHL
ncbi:unnamed protein product [Gongylonema pulchrum]|uniref:DUF3265 domain-containing protein n=1 Tax=Gongylonema pulchrum TaxID=637853 RepID=A0A183DKD2_9BILA|nr:unnamed protein product [Gongylonema pulchrum]